MDNSLVLRETGSRSWPIDVLILVVMDNSLVLGQQGLLNLAPIVLILVVMDNSLVHTCTKQLL